MGSVGQVKKNTFTTSWLEEVILLQQNAKWLNCEVWKLIFCHLNNENTCNYHHFKLLVSFLGSKTKILQPLLYFSENIQRGNPWKNIFLVFFLMHYFPLWDHRRLLECHFGVLECWKPQNEPISKSSKNFGKYAKGGPLEKKIFSFLFNTVFYSGIPKETIRMPFRGLTMLKSRKLVIKGGLCYRFAMVVCEYERSVL